MATKKERFADIEVWKDIQGYEGLYQVSNYGRVKSLERYVRNGKDSQMLLKEMILKPKVNKQKYQHINLWKNNKQKTFKVHRLVGEVFIPNLKNKSQINHIDGNKKNNHVTNLEWATNSENQEHGLKNGLIKSSPIVQFDKKGNFINIFNSISEAKRHLNIATVSQISLVCQGKRKTAGGYRWKYASEVKNNG